MDEQSLKKTLPYLRKIHKILSEDLFYIVILDKKTGQFAYSISDGKLGEFLKLYCKMLAPLDELADLGEPDSPKHFVSQSIYKYLLTYLTSEEREEVEQGKEETVEITNLDHTHHIIS